MAMKFVLALAVSFGLAALSAAAPTLRGGLWLFSPDAPAKLGIIGRPGDFHPTLLFVECQIGRASGLIDIESADLAKLIAANAYLTIVSRRDDQELRFFIDSIRQLDAGSTQFALEVSITAAILDQWAVPGNLTLEIGHNATPWAPTVVHELPRMDREESVRAFRAACFG